LAWGLPLLASQAGTEPRKAAEGGKVAAAGPHQAPAHDSAVTPMPTIRRLPLQALRLPNGMRLYLIEDHELPVIFGTAMWPGGSVFDPVDEPGLARLTAAVLRTGGSHEQSGSEIDAALERMGGRVTTATSATAARISFYGLKENAPELLQMVRDLLVTPGFRLEKLELAKTQAKAAMLANSDGLAEARRRLAAQLYGAQTPYGRLESRSAIARIHNGDVRAFFARTCIPTGVVLAVEGDFDAARLQPEIEKLFAGWTAPPADRAEQQPRKAPPAPGIYIGDGKDLTRTSFAIGQLGGAWRDPDSAAWAVLMELFGGPRSRLRRELPSTEANSLEIGAFWEPAFETAGLAEISGSTASYDFPHVIETVRAEIERLRSGPVSEEEWRSAREAALERLALAGDSREKRLGRDLDFEFFGYPAGFAGLYQKAIAAVTRADIERLAKERLQWSRFTVVAIGDAEALARQLADTGRPVATLAAPAAEKSAAPSSGGNPETAMQILAKAIAAAGGAEKLSALRDATRTALWEFAPRAGGGLVIQTDQWLAPASLRQDVNRGPGQIFSYTDGKSGWMSNGQSVAPLAATNLERMRRDLFEFYPRLLLSGGIQGRTVSAVDGNAIEIHEAEFSAQVIFDSRTGLPGKVLYEAKNTAGLPIAVEEDLLDFREVQGLKLPFAVKILENGQDVATVTIADWKVNRGLKLTDLLRRP
ncbi:MAG TPA: pitrilysin family protein, partial [Bryobacteraceae bacterium]|nr:pitrilysin family protein [Bryobacteraceae bacterium]